MAYIIFFSLSTPGGIPSGVSLKPKYCTLLAPDSHFGSFAFRFTALSPQKGSPIVFYA